MMLMHRRRESGRRPSGFCGSGSARLNSEERSRLKLLIEQVGSLMRNAAMRPHNRAAAKLDLDERIYAVLLRTEELATEPMRQPNILFISDQPPKGSARRIDIGALTARERQVAEAMATGFSRPEIARQLGLSHHTVVSMAKRIYQKFAIRRRAELARIVLR